MRLTLFPAANVLKITHFGTFCTPLCFAELPLFWHSFSFEQLANRRISFSRPLVWALFKFIIFRLNFRYILPCRTVPNYAYCLNNAVQVEEFQLWFAQTDTVKAPYCNGKHLHFQNILSKCHYCEFIVLAILGLRTTEKEEMPNQKRN